jgi:hypothetical protein
MSIIGNIRRGWRDGQREQEAGDEYRHADGRGYYEDLDGGLIEGNRKGPWEDKYYRSKGTPARPKPDESTLAALVERCEQLESENAALLDGVEEWRAALAERDEYIHRLQSENASLNQWRAAVDERDATIRALHRENAARTEQLTRVTATRDRYQTNGKRIKAEKLDLESVVKFPGVKKVLLKALHPDTGTGGDVRARTEIFKTLMAVCDRIEGKQ